MCLPGTIDAVRREADARGIVGAEPEEVVVDRRSVLAGGAAAALAALWPGRAAAAPAPDRFADLTHVFREGFPVFGGDPPARTTIARIPSEGFYSQEWRFQEHSGTHMDAPGHFVAGGRLSPQIRPAELMGLPIAVVDVAARAARNPDTVVTPDDLRRYERRHGRIPRGALVAMNSGWARKAGNPAEFKGGPAYPNYHFPGFGIDAVEWLIANRSPAAIGVDTMSLDPGNSTTFPVHVRWLGTNRYGLENLNNLGSIPPRGARAFVGLIPWQRGSGGPSRVIATWGGGSGGRGGGAAALAG
jgi:kynurenine formamidase